jgi:hypothetical protein
MEGIDFVRLLLATKLTKQDGPTELVGGRLPAVHLETHRDKRGPQLGRALSLVIWPCSAE